MWRYEGRQVHQLRLHEVSTTVRKVGTDEVSEWTAGIAAVE
jgi:hypothetical protein